MRAGPGVAWYLALEGRSLSQVRSGQVTSPLCLALSWAPQTELTGPGTAIGGPRLGVARWQDRTQARVAALLMSKNNVPDLADDFDLPVC